MLSAVILAKNEEGRIKGCLESVKWADEIIVVDNGSIDATVEIAKKYTSQILKEEKEDFSLLRNKGAAQTKEDWIMYIDADERVTKSLREEIQNIIKNGDKSAYAIGRKNVIFGKEVNYGPYKKDWVIRLFKREDFEHWYGRVHESVKFKGELGYTRSSFLHLTHRDLDHFILKSLEWSKIDASLRLQAGHPKMTWWRFVRIFITELWQQGVKRRGFFSGTVGIIDSLLQVFFFYMSYVRLWQLQQPKPLSEVYDDIDKKLLENDFDY